MIRIILGLLIAMGAVGTLDTDPNASMLVATGLSIFGLLLMLWGVRSLDKF